MTLFTLSTAAPALNLKRLLIIRGVFLITVMITVAVSFWQFKLPLPYPPLLWVLSALTLINLAAVVQLQHRQTVSELNFFVQLLIDLIAISLLLYLSGGADNPFVSYYLVPLCIAAATLNWRFIWPLLALALMLYTSLFFFHVPLAEIAPQGHQHHQSSAVSLHTLGMWLNFLVSALLIGFFVARMGSSLRQQDEALADLREQQLRDDQLMAVATLAAGTAHELGSPLTTMKTLIKEMQLDSEVNQAKSGDDPSQLQKDLSLLQSQVNHCANTLQQLTHKARAFKHGATTQNAQAYCTEIIDNWLLMRPEVSATVDVAQTHPEQSLRLDPTIAQSITNLLNNAADANPNDIEVSCFWSPDQLNIDIADRGPGIDRALKPQLGQAFTSAKGDGRGLGLFLTRAAVERHHGKISLEHRDGGGTLTKLILPLSPEVER